MSKRGRFAGLDTLRFIAAIFVVVGHIPLNQASAGLPHPSWGALFFRGAPAVKLFFSLSGFLITYLLLDEMARTGIRFDRFYSGAPVCSPTRGSCLTGRHPYRYGIFFANADSGTEAPSKYALPARETTVAELVKPLGYATAHFGKWHLGDFAGPKQSSPTDNGFDEFFSTTRKVPTVDPDGYWTQEGRVPGTLQGDDNELIMERALDFMRRAVARRQPFLAVIWFHAPHIPFLATARHRAPFASHAESQQHYWGSITSLDEQMGRLRSTLDQLGVRRDTMLWYCADNGPEGDRESAAAPGSAGP